eukprot:7271600-Prymnesium_polylepis.1
MNAWPCSASTASTITPSVSVTVAMRDQLAESPPPCAASSAGAVVSRLNMMSSPWCVPTTTRSSCSSSAEISAPEWIIAPLRSCANKERTARPACLPVHRLWMLSESAVEGGLCHAEVCRADFQPVQKICWPMAYDAPGGGVGRYARPAVPLAR